MQITAPESAISTTTAQNQPEKLGRPISAKNTVGHRFPIGVPQMNLEYFDEILERKGPNSAKHTCRD